MKWRFLLLALLPLVGAEAAERSSSERFMTAQEAYNKEQYADAAQGYKALLDQGVINTEVRYNLANAYFKNGQLSDAVWHYRKAWYTAPRDPDIRANLRFALHATGAIEPTPVWFTKALFLLSQKEWIWVSMGAYLLFMLLLIARKLFCSARTILSRMSLILIALFFIAMGGWWNWQSFITHPEAVVIKAGATTLFGPVKGSTAHYNLPLSALVRQRGIPAQGWIQIEYDGKNGWIEEEYIHSLFP